MSASARFRDIPEIPLSILLTATGVWWVLAMDGRRARLFVRKGRRSTFAEMSNLIADEDGHRIEPHESGHHHGRSEKTERQFTEQVAHRIEACAVRDSFDHLAVFAAPAALGVLREAMGPRTEARLRQARALDIVGEPTKRILERLNDWG